MKEISALFIKHQEIIEKAYNRHNSEKESLYFTLKSILFNYVERPEPTSLKNRKRKKPFKESNEEDETIKKTRTEINRVEQITNKITNLLKEKCLHQNLDLRQNTDSDNNQFKFSNDVFCNQKFLKFKGENSTESLILYEMNGIRYLIPSHSRFFNYDIRDIGSIDQSVLGKFDFITIDPPWKNKYVRRVKKIKQEYGYEMLENNTFTEIPIRNLINCNSIVLIWCTNSPTHQNTVLEKLLPAWNLKFIKKLYWIKLNKNGNTICKFKNPGQKQPYEVIFIASHIDYIVPVSFLNDLEFIVSIPSIIHSHKPPLVEIFKKYLPINSKCLELFARYLYPNFTSIGLEVLKLMDERFYDCVQK